MRLRIRIIVLASLVVTACAGIGCDSLDRIYGSVSGAVSEGAEKFTTRTYRDAPIHIDLAGPIAVDVETFSGKVVIESTDTVEGVVINYTRRALHGADRRAEADFALAEIDFDHTVIPGPLGPIVRIRVTTTHAEPHFLRADVRVRMPAVDGIRVRTEAGEVVATGVEGAVDIITSEADVRVMTERPMVRPVTIINNAGDIHYRIRAESTGAFDVHTVRGRVTHHVKHGRLTVERGTSFDRLHATLNDGTNPIVLRAADGDVRIAVVPAPLQVGHFIVD